MHYVACRSHRTQQHKFNITCPGTLFTKTALGVPEDEKLCVDVLRHGRTRMHYVTRIPHRMQKYMFGATCPSTLFLDSLPVPSEHNK
jgi:hypothetical protein